MCFTCGHIPDGHALPADFGCDFEQVCGVDGQHPDRRNHDLTGVPGQHLGKTACALGQRALIGRGPVDIDRRLWLADPGGRENRPLILFGGPAFPDPDVPAPTPHIRAPY